MVTVLVANGCSNTRGQELADPEREAWPALLGDRLGARVVNLGRDGASNRRIVRSTVTVVGELVAQSSSPASEFLVVIVWTAMSRFEYHSDTERPEKRANMADLDVDLNWQRIGSWRKDLRHRPSRAYYRHLWDEHGQLTNFVVDWLMLDAYLRRLGVRVYYSHAFPVPHLPPSLQQQLRDGLDPASVWGGLPTDESATFAAVPAALSKGPWGHPLVDGHHWFATQLHDWLAGSI